MYASQLLKQRYAPLIIQKHEPFTKRRQYDIVLLTIQLQPKKARMYHCARCGLNNRKPYLGPPAMKQHFHLVNVIANLGFRHGLEPAQVHIPLALSRRRKQVETSSCL